VRKLKILITGIGITGKSTMRRILTSMLRDIGLPVEHYDADKFKELRHLSDVDCLEKLPDTFSKGILYIIEDVHGPLPSSILSLKEYDLILYLKPGILSHLMFWVPRMVAWFEKGLFSWEADKGWKGTGRAEDFRNIFPIFKAVFRDFYNRKRWIKEDLKEIYPFPHLLVRPVWSRKRSRFRLNL